MARNPLYKPLFTDDQLAFFRISHNGDLRGSSRQRHAQGVGYLKMARDRVRDAQVPGDERGEGGRSAGIGALLMGIPGEAGLDFVTHSLDTLHPGGVAIHTTEFNVTSNDETVEDGPVVLYRRRDLEGLVAKLETAGHEVAALDLEPGTGLLDEYADVPPFLDGPHIRLALRGHVTTSVALVIRKAA